MKKKVEFLGFLLILSLLLVLGTCFSYSSSRIPRPTRRERRGAFLFGFFSYYHNHRAFPSYSSRRSGRRSPAFTSRQMSDQIIETDSPALAHLLDTVATKLQEEHHRHEDDNDGSNEHMIKLRPDDEASMKESPSTIHVNSLVFEILSDDRPSSGDDKEVMDPGQYVLAILDANDRVDLEKLKQFVDQQDAFISDQRSTISLRLAPSDQVQDLCGFAPGTVPPFGTFPAPQMTIVEASLQASTIQTLIAGGGLEDHHLHLNKSVLLKRDGILVHSFREEVKLNGEAKPEEDSTPGSLAAIPMSAGHEHERRHAKPYFDIDPPEDSVVEQVLQNTDAVNPLKPMWITMVGRISGVRRMAKTLAFFDFCPVSGPLPTPQAHPWRNPNTGKEMAVQLICGKTYCRQFNNDEQAAADGIKRIKPGQMVLIQGKTNVGNRESLDHWLTKQSLDIVLWNYQILFDNASNAFLEPPLFNSYDSKEASTKMMTMEMVKQQKRMRKRAAPNMPFLKLSDLYGEEATKTAVTVVDDLETVNAFSKGLESMILKLERDAEKKTANEVLENPYDGKLIGIDCEWRPNFLTESAKEPQPVLLLQVSLHESKKVFLLDLQTLLRPLQKESEPMTALEAATSESISMLFSSKELVKVGFMVHHDLKLLAESYPHIAAFQLVHSVLEVSTMAKKSLQINKVAQARKLTQSLNNVSEHFLQRSLDKEQQISDWSLRPLTKEQEDYAALDAVVTPVIVEQILANTSATFFDTPKSWRFLLYDDKTADARSLKRLGAKQSMGLYHIVEQRWFTENEAPRLPSIPQGGDEPFVDGSGTLRVPSQSISLEREHINNVLHPTIGLRVAKTKDQVLRLFLNGLDSFPSDGKVDFYPRSGFIEFSNAVFLFVNMPRKKGNAVKNYNNEWLEDEQSLTWYFRERDWQQGTSGLARKMLGAESNVLLFVRLGTKKFISCGRITVQEMDADIVKGDIENSEAHSETVTENDSTLEWWRLTKLHLILQDWDDLQSSSDFLTLLDPERASSSLDDSDSGSDS